MTSGWPNFAVSTAILMVHAIAVSQPPPSAKPLTAAITGLPRFSMRSSTSCPKRLDSSASSAVACASSLMSAPAIKALSPAPVRMTPRTASSSRASSNAVRRSVQVGVFRALSTLGRLTVTVGDARPSFRTRHSRGSALPWRSGRCDCGRRRERCCCRGHVHLSCLKWGPGRWPAAPHHTKAPKPVTALPMIRFCI